MNILSNRYFWAVLLILLGVLFLVEEIYNLDIPVFTILISGFFILMGVQMILGRKGRSGEIRSGRESTILFSSSRTDYLGDDAYQEYNTIFSNRNLNLADLNLLNGSMHLEINTVFGDTKVFLPRNVNYRIKNSVVFGNASTPTGERNFFGDDIEQSVGYDQQANTLYIEANTVFGSLKIFQS